mmetsp:Transcript_65406/g.164839  ORF Transcript_65406/g.164839 Transcript_65406/m.164839 type:complete len:86 (+) Transcript_65406:101-358(+)
MARCMPAGGRDCTGAGVGQYLCSFPSTMGGTGGLGCMMGGAIVSAVSVTHGAYALPWTTMGGADVNAVPVSLTDLACTAAGRGNA